MMRGRGVSQLIVTLLLVTIALAVGLMFAYMYTDLLGKYTSWGQTAISRVGSINLELSSISSTSYTYDVYINIINLSSATRVIYSGNVAIMFKGNSNTITKSCPISYAGSIDPGKILTVKASCTLTTGELYYLFGNPHPQSDTVKQSASFLYLIINTDGGSMSIP
jgi:hypothetical protein